MKFTFKNSLLLLAALLTFVSCARDPAYKKAEVSQEEQSNFSFTESQTFEVVLASLEPENVSYPQELFCNCKVTEVPNTRCAEYHKLPGEPAVCIRKEPDGTYRTMMICERTCGQVNVFPTVISLVNKKGSVSVLSKGLLIPEGIDIEQQYQDTELPDGSIVRTVKVKVTKEQQLDKETEGEGTYLLVLVDRA